MGFCKFRKQRKSTVKHDDGFLVPAKVIEFDALTQQCFSITLIHVFFTSHNKF